jgi:hypothetical protein
MSEKSIAQKMLLKPGYRLLLVNAPDGYLQRLGELPAGAQVVGEATPPVDAIQVFLSTKAELQHQLQALRPLLGPKTLLWVTYPKQSSKVPSDVNRDIIWAEARQLGFDAVANFAVDDVWSALRLKLESG